MAWYEEKNKKTQKNEKVSLYYYIISENRSHDYVLWAWGRRHYLHLGNKECTWMESTRIFEKSVTIIFGKLDVIVGDAVMALGSLISMRIIRFSNGTV